MTTMMKLGITIKVTAPNTPNKVATKSKQFQPLAKYCLLPTAIIFRPASNKNTEILRRD